MDNWMKLDAVCRRSGIDTEALINFNAMRHEPEIKIEDDGTKYVDIEGLHYLLCSLGLASLNNYGK